MPSFGLDRLRSLGLLSSGGMPIAVDFGAHSLKVLQLTQAETPTLLAAATIDNPENIIADPAKRLAWQFEQLPKVIKSGGFKGRRAVCAIPASHTFSKHVQLAVGDDISLAELTAAAVAGQLNCLPDSLLCRPVMVPGAAGAGANKVEVIALTAARALVNRMMEAIRACRLEPVGMHPECTAMLRAFDYITKRTEDAELVSLYLDLGYGSTTIAIAHGKELVFTKTIALGGRNFDQTISRQAHCGMEEARAMRLRMTSMARTAAPVQVSSVPAGMAALEAAIRKAQTAGPPKTIQPVKAEPSPVSTAIEEEERRTTQATPSACAPVPQPASNVPDVDNRIDLSEPLETLTDEINLCMRYHQGLFPAKRVGRTVFVGGEARHTALCQHIAKVLRLPAHVADPFARIARSGSEPVNGLDISKPQPGWAVAVGLCLSPTDL